MSSSSNPAQGLVPNFNAWLGTAWGSGADYYNASIAGWVCGATNLVFGQNPPYYLDDFLAMYPKFFGAATVLAGCVTIAGSQQVTVPSTAGLLVGQFLVCGDLPKGTVITAVGSGTITVSNAAATSDAAATLQVYQAPVVPVAVILMYLNLASASLVQARWEEQWTVAMAWFIAHYCTLYARSDAQEILTAVQTTLHGEVPAGNQPGTTFTLSAAPPNGTLQGLYKNGQFLTPGIDYTLAGTAITTTVVVTAADSLYAQWPVNTSTSTPVTYTAAQVAAQGIANGIEVSKSVGDVSASYAALESLSSFGQWNLTIYGQQLATMAKIVGMGPMVIW